ncbi:MAG: class I SAM-dependent methyltransferase [Actinomycetota bacterium]
MRRFRPFAFDVSNIDRITPDRRDRRIRRDHQAVTQLLGRVDASDRPNLQFEIDVLDDPENFRANWIAIATHLRHVPNLARSRGLELGCSVGTKLLIMQRLGAGEIVGCDYAEHLVEDGRYWIEETGTEGIELVASGESAVPFANAEFDWVTLQMVYCQLGDAAIEPLIAEMYRVLRPGGIALVHDGANPHHAPTADAMYDYYREVELGEGTAEAPAGPLFVMRRALIAGEFTGLDGETIDALARNTAYMRSEDVRSAVDVFVRGGEEPASPFVDRGDELVPPVMLDGQAVRRPTDPFVMRDQFAASGFDVEFRQSYFGAPVDDPVTHFAEDPSVFLVARKA